MTEYEWLLKALPLACLLAFPCVWMTWSLLSDLTGYTSRGGKLRLRADVTVTALVTVLVGLAPWHLDRDDTPAERVALLTPVAQVIAKACTGHRRASWCTAQAWHECKLSRYVLEDRCADGPDGAKCDNGRATGPWQNQRQGCPGAWAGATGDGKFQEFDPANRAERWLAGVKCALRGYNAGVHRCGTDAGGFAAQGKWSQRPGWCLQSWAVRRVSTMRQVERKLWALQEFKR